jgi:hypothetical protein
VKGLTGLIIRAIKTLIIKLVKGSKCENLVSGTKGRAFESRIAHHHKINRLNPFFVINKNTWQAMPHTIPTCKEILNQKSRSKRSASWLIYTSEGCQVTAQDTGCPKSI